MKTTKRNKKDLIDIDIIDLNGSSKDGGKKKSAGKKTASAKKTAGGRSAASGTKASGRKAAAGKSAKGRQGSAGASASGGESAAPVRRKGNREFAVITYFFLALFICLSGYFVYFLQFKSEDFINNPYNARLATLSDTVIRGAHSLRRRTGAGQDGCGGGRYRDESLSVRPHVRPCCGVQCERYGGGWSWTAISICCGPTPLCWSGW